MTLAKQEDPRSCLNPDDHPIMSEWIPFLVWIWALRARIKTFSHVRVLLLDFVWIIWIFVWESLSEYLNVCLNLLFELVPVDVPFSWMLKELPKVKTLICETRVVWCWEELLLVGVEESRLGRMRHKVGLTWFTIGWWESLEISRWVAILNFRRWLILSIVQPCIHQMRSGALLAETDQGHHVERGGWMRIASRLEARSGSSNCWIADWRCWRDFRYFRDFLLLCFKLSLLLCRGTWHGVGPFLEL